MQTRISTVVIMIMLGSGFPVSAQDDEGFTLVKKEGKVSLYERWIPLFSDPSVTVRELKTEFYYDNTIEAGLQLLRDEKRAALWKGHLEEYKIYPQADAKRWVEYTYHDIPWPVSDQDHLTQYMVHKDSPMQTRVSFTSIDDEKLAPLRDGVTRIKLRGNWLFERHGSRVYVTYRVSSIPVGIPRAFTDPLVRNGMVNMIQKFIALAEQH